MSITYNNPTSSSPEQLHRRARRLSYFTVGYNLLEGAVSVVVGAIAGSTALLGFGVDSFVESLSGGIMIWRFSGSRSDCRADEQRRERLAARLVGVALLLLGAYVAYESAEKLYLQEPPDRSPWGLVIAVLSLVVMPVLFYFKRNTALQMGSRSLLADSKQTLACIMLSVALLVGVGLHYYFGLWHADPLAGLLISLFLVREGYQAWKEQELCCG